MLCCIILLGGTRWQPTQAQDESVPMFSNQSVLLRDNPIQLNYGIAITDIDGDGQFEIVVAGFGYRNLILKWDGTQYTDVAPPLLADEGRRAIGVAACDIDGDGLEELYVLNTDTFSGEKRIADRFFDDNGDTWADLFSLEINSAVQNLTAGRSVACVDRNGDGRYGIFVANYGGPMRLYELDEDGFLVDVAPDAGVDLTTGGRGVVSFPILSNNMDIFAGNENGPNFLFINRGDGTYDEIAGDVGLDDPFENVRGVTPLDANDDGVLDIAYGNWEGPHRLYIQNENGTFTNIAPLDMAEPSTIRTVIAADFDNDGYEELFFNNIGQRNRLFGQRDGQWIHLDIGEAGEPTGLGTGAAVGDFNQDGRLELIIAHGEQGPQPLTLYSTPENDNNWIRVQPLTQFGAPARGTIVRIVSNDRTQIRAIDAGSGYLCQMEPIAHFGLGQSDSVQSIEVNWPDGSQLILENPDINQVIIVEYPS